MIINVYKKYEPYLAYTQNTDEKGKLQNYIKNEFKKNNLPISAQDTGQEILDVGCGNGVNTLFLAKLFKKHHITAVDFSLSQIEFAKRHNNANNINYYCLSFKNWKISQKFDFILVSHVLQYIDGKPLNFIKKIIQSLAKGGEAWIVQQTKKGMYEIIKHQKSFLDNPIFANWFTFEDYLPLVKRLVKNKPLTIKTKDLPTSFKSISFAKPTNEDKMRLEFILGLDKPFDKQSFLFKKHLTRLTLGSSGRILHPNGIIKIRKLDI